MKNKTLNFANLVHWGAIAGGIIVSAATIAAGSGDVRLAGYATMILSISQAVHKAVDAQAHAVTLAAATDVAGVVASAAASGSPVQEKAVNTAVAVVKRAELVNK